MNRRMRPGPIIPAWERRLVASGALAWLAGFVWFALVLPQPAPLGQRTEGIVVLTGGSGRIARAVAVLESGSGPQLLVSGVNPAVSRGLFARKYAVPPALLACCITLGVEAINTTTNARETAAWVARHHLHSIRLVTNDWHMRRALLDLSLTVPHGTTILPDAVPSQPRLVPLFVEYNKFLGHWAVALLWR